MMTEALEFHLGSMAKDGDAMPETTDCTVDFSEEAPANGVEHCQVGWLTVCISPEFVGTPATKEVRADQAQAQYDAEIDAGTLRNVLNQTGIKHPKFAE